jgi:uncharacterized protein YlxW (UPF0749 family)
VRARPAVARAVDASMGLLNDVTSKALDPGYAEAAARPRVERTAGGRAARAVGHLLLAVVLGLVTVVAVTQLRTREMTERAPNALLEREITRRTAETDEMASTVERLSREIAQIQADAVASLDPELFARLEEYELASGAIGVTGAGLVMVLDDGQSETDDEAARVQDVDLQVLTNGLWASGAEAIAINGQRLTSLSAIRSAGQAILVDLTPILAPYRVEVVGDAHEIQTAFARSTAAGHLAFLSGTYGITVTTSAEADLELPGAGNVMLRHATQLDVASSGSSQEEGSP